MYKPITGLHHCSTLIIYDDVIVVIISGGFGTSWAEWGSVTDNQLSVHHEQVWTSWASTTSMPAHWVELSSKTRYNSGITDLISKNTMWNVLTWWCCEHILLTSTVVGSTWQITYTYQLVSMSCWTCTTVVRWNIHEGKSWPWEIVMKGEFALPVA